MPEPSPAFTWLLIFILLHLLSVWIHTWTTTVRVHTRAAACLDFSFYFHETSLFSLAVRIHDWSTACFDFGFDLHVGSPTVLN